LTAIKRARQKEQETHKRQANPELEPGKLVITQENKSVWRRIRSI
jgi:hypothetical protein